MTLKQIDNLFWNVLNDHFAQYNSLSARLEYVSHLKYYNSTIFLYINKIAIQWVEEAEEDEEQVKNYKISLC